MFGSNGQDDEESKVKRQVKENVERVQTFVTDIKDAAVAESEKISLDLDLPAGDQSRRFLSKDVLLPSAILCSSVFLGAYVYRHFVRRIATPYEIPESYFRRRSLLGRATSVGDADNFRFYHTPGGIFAGWGWLREVPKTQKKLTNQTIPVRLYGIDAPECAHFGKPAQKYSDEALNWLRSYTLGKRVRVTPLARDQYGRIVGYATVWKWNGVRDVSLDMLKKGWAVVYEGKTGAEFHGIESKLRKAEANSKRKRRGMFKHGVPKETPAEYKKKYKV